MNAIPEQYIDASKEFRTYMRTQKGEKGQFLSNLMDGAEIHLTRIIQSGIDESFTILYDSTITIEQLVRYYVTIQYHDDWLTTGNGHTAWKSLKYFLSFRSEKEGIDWRPIYESVKLELEKQKEEAKNRQERERRSKQEFTEGNVVESHYDRHERNHSARIKCIEYYGCKCAICGFDFESRYGEVGKEFIEVHHIVPISSTDGEHDIDPISDLIPVCSNCHSILHRRKPDPYLPEEVKGMLDGNKR